MTTAGEQTAAAIFADARQVYDKAIESLEAGGLRDAAEKAWLATKRATDALILLRTGEEPRTSGQTTRGLRSLRRVDPSLESLRLRYAARLSYLHGRCFYDGILEPEEDVIGDIRETSDYIQDAENQGRRS